MNIVGWPKLVIRYPTTPEHVAALLPPGLDPVAGPEAATVLVGVYCAPVHGEPELGISTKIAARWGSRDGWYTLGIGIDQESAIFVSRETNGQPKFPCDVRYFRLRAGPTDRIEAHATHQGTTFLSYTGTPVGPPQVVAPADQVETEDFEWWVKASRAVASGTPSSPGPAYDLDPFVVQVRSVSAVVERQPLEGELTLRASRWDPYTDLLPAVGPAAAELVTARHSARDITPAGPLDPIAFWPFADTIGGSRWPGDRGAPRGR